MREYPITVHTPNVYHINSNASSNLYDDNQYQRKLSTIDADTNYHQYHQQTTAALINHHGNNKNSTNYICTSNGDLTAATRQGGGGGGRLHNFNNNKCNRPNKINSKINNQKNTEQFFETIETAEDEQHNNRSGSYSILNAITNAVTTGNCTNTIYPKRIEHGGGGDIDQITIDPDQLSSDSQQIHNLKNAQSSSAHLNHSNGQQYQQYNHYDIDNDRPHQFPSANYKHSYLLWIGTPVAARYTRQKNIFFFCSLFIYDFFKLFFAFSFEVKCTLKTL